MAQRTSNGMLIERWWVPAVRGVLALVLGAVAFLWPGATLAGIVIVWGACAFAEGMTTVLVGGLERWWSMAFAGLVGIACGIAAVAFTVSQPEGTAAAVVFLIATWAIVRGTFDIVEGFDEFAPEWLQMSSGILSVAFGTVISFLANSDPQSIVPLLGSYAVLDGVLLLSLASRQRRLDRVSAHAFMS